MSSLASNSALIILVMLRLHTRYGVSMSFGEVQSRLRVIDEKLGEKEW
jgi:hypothetical protein